ncbi:MAG: MBL fold metallo-hydrolase [Synechococcaceae cyanobacterium SM2_3_1]|nr:MBL fold metallo-hydrolase [Synechococcaceae cyanobacterium SM2_3_1]
MIATTEPTRTRLTIQVADLAPGTKAIRSLDWDRSRFDIEFAIENGTTYNSFLIQGDSTALVDTSHEKFRQLYLDTLRQWVDPRSIDYLIISHTEPDHSGLVKDFLEMAPNLTVVGSKVAIQFLEDLVHTPFKKLVVKSGSQLDLGQGHRLEFVSAPNLHWPDTMLTYDHGTQILYTCDVFGMHYCDDYLFDENLDLISADYQLYYDCLMGPNARSVLSAIKRMGDLPPIKTIATGHGPLLQHHLTELVERYRTWSQAQAKTDTLAVIFYLSEYGYTDQLAHAIGQGIHKTGVAVELVDLRSADTHEVRELTGMAAAVVLGMSPVSGPESAHTQTLVNTILATVHGKQVFGLFDSGGDDDESIDLLRNRLQELGGREIFPPIQVRSAPSETTYQRCDEAGTDLGQWLTRERTIKQMKSLDNDLDKALGRLSGGLYIITAKKGEATSGMLASWVAQASTSPPGITLAVAKDRAIESFMRVGDRFVLNVLEEGNYQSLMKHFLKRFPPGADRFAGLKTYPASHGSPILADALAYLECEVVSRMDAQDHWIVYSTAESGRVAKMDALTAVHHRKVGNHY